MLKLSVYRTEQKSPEGEQIQAAGWKPIGRGQMRLLHDTGVYFLEFRPEVCAPLPRDDSIRPARVPQTGCDAAVWQHHFRGSIVEGSGSPNLRKLGLLKGLVREQPGSLRVGSEPAR